MSGNLGDVGSLPETVAQEMVEEILKRHDFATDVSLDDCRSFVQEFDEQGPLAYNDLSEGEIDGIARILFTRINSGKKPTK